MRGGRAEMLRVQAAMDGMALFGEKDRMGHRRVVPLLPVPDLVHRSGGVGSRGGCIAVHAGRHRPGIFLHAVDEDGHLLRGLVDIDQDGESRACQRRPAPRRRRYHRRHRHRLQHPAPQRPLNSNLQSRSPAPGSHWCRSRPCFSFNSAGGGEPSGLVSAYAGKASITAKNGTTSRVRKWVEEAERGMF